jgi:hypothetical protein
MAVTARVVGEGFDFAGVLQCGTMRHFPAGRGKGLYGPCSRDLTR